MSSSRFSELLSRSEYKGQDTAPKTGKDSVTGHASDHVPFPYPSCNAPLSFPRLSVTLLKLWPKPSLSLLVLSNVFCGPLGSQYH